MSGMTGRARQGRAKTTIAVAMAVPLVLTACGSEDPAPVGQGEAEVDGVAQAVEWEPERDIEWIVPYSPGGGYDTYSRGIAQTMGGQDCLPEGVNVTVRNVEPVTLGITNMFTAEPNGYTVGMLPMPAAVAQEVLFPDVARWVTEDFTVLGSVDANAYVVYVADDSPYETIDDLLAAEDLTALTVERGSSSDLAAQAAIEALGLDAEVTYGAEGSAEVVTAALRGDADFFVYGASDVVNYIESGDVKPLLFLGTEDQRSVELAWLQDVPGTETAGVPDLAGTVTELRSIVAPPELPEEIATWWRTCLLETMESEAFLEWAETAGRPLVVRGHELTEEAMLNQAREMRELLPQLDIPAES